MAVLRYDLQFLALLIDRFSNDSFKAADDSA